jgi:diguanylate cyclase (GGDEF)-like protein/PAS domain S-box-containing protein
MSVGRVLPILRVLRRHPTSALVVVVTAAVSAFLASGPGGPVTRGTLAELATALMAAAAGVAGILRAHGRSGRMRSVWAAVGLGALVYAFGGRLVPSGIRPDLGYLGMVPLVSLGLLLVPVARQSVANRIRSVVDGLMIAASLVLISWIFVLKPLLAAGGGTGYDLDVRLAYPISDVLLATVVLYMFAVLRRGGRDSVPLMLIGTAMLTIGVCDSARSYSTLDASYRPGGLVDIGWLVGFALVLLAARHAGDAVPALAAPAAADGETDDRQPFAILVPYAAVVGTLLISVVWFAIAGHGDAFFGWCRSVLILLIVTRQLLTLLENRHLTAYLESRVAKRTAELYAREQRFRALVRQSSESVAVVEPDSTVRYQSESIERIFGYPAAQLVGQRLVDAAGPVAGTRIAAAIESVLGTPYASTTIEVAFQHRVTGRPRQSEMTVTNLLDDASVNGIVLNTRDVHDAHELQEQLVHEAYHDGLTQLASRALFREKLEQALDGCRRTDDVAILFLDLDGFKEVNDSLGHAAGDQLLVQVADRLRDSVRAGDTVARFGGDEFAVLVESIVARADAETVADRIVEAVGAPVVIDGRELHVGASIGIASAADAADMEQLLRNADLAMYKAKSGGGSGYAMYDPHMHNALVQRLELESDLRVALERAELALHYQPTVDLVTGEIVGFEALVRWHHPTRGVVAPFDFIGIAESTGLIVPLGRWVLAEACRQAVAWGAGTGRRLKMAVNVSVRQFEDCDLAAMVSEVIAETGMPVDQLCLEMTESVLLTDTDENLTQLLRLKALGVTLAMDDFGTGYSSLAYLRRFPMDTLKIDRSFVDRLGGDSEDVALVRTIVRLGQSLGMSTVAEGIEDAAQLAALRELGCDLAQGYFLSRPVPAAEAGRFLREGLPTAPRPLILNA